MASVANMVDEDQTNMKTVVEERKRRETNEMKGFRYSVEKCCSRSRFSMKRKVSNKVEMSEESVSAEETKTDEQSSESEMMRQGMMKTEMEAKLSEQKGFRYSVQKLLRSRSRFSIMIRKVSNRMDMFEESVSAVETKTDEQSSESEMMRPGMIKTEMEAKLSEQEASKLFKGLSIKELIHGRTQN